MSEFAEKAKTIGVSRHRGKSINKPVIDERDGTVGGYHKEHWNDSQDAVVMPKRINYKLGKKED